MKKYNLMKVLFITVLVTWLLTFIIPASTIASGIARGSIAPIGIWNAILNALVSVTYFNMLGLYIVVIAAFYGVLGLTDQYNQICERIARKFKDKRKLALVISILFFSLLALVVSDPLFLLIFVPFFWNILLKLEIDKKHILLATIVSMLVGSMGLLYNSTVATNFSIDTNSRILSMFILGLLSISALLVFALISLKNSYKEKLKFAKEEKILQEKEIKVKKIPYLILTILFGSIGVNKIYSREYRKAIISFIFCFTLIPFIISIADFIIQILNKKDKKGYISINSNKRNNILLSVGMGALSLFIIVAIISWEVLFKTKIFTNLNKWFYGIKLNDYLSIKNFLGTTDVIGSWSFGGLAVLLIILSVIIMIIYKININKYISTVTNSIKKVLPIAITVILINVVLMIAYSSGIVVTMIDFTISISGKAFNVITATFASILSATFLSDILYSSSIFGSILKAKGITGNSAELIALVLRSVASFMALIVPTSAGLIIGLYYFDIPYTKWVKYIWKLVIILLLLVIVFTTIAVLI